MSLFRKCLAKVKNYQPGKPIEEVKRELGLKEVYKLASNEIPFVPGYLKNVLVKELANINRYPESESFYLRQALAKKLAVKENQLILGNGSDEIITLTLRAFVDEGDEVIIAYPTFLVYAIQANLQAAVIKEVPLKNNRYDLEAMAAAVTDKTKVVIIANPDNPTGSYVDQAQVEKFLQVIPKDVLVFFDEAYFEFAPKDFPDSLGFLNSRGNIIFSRTFSKAYGLAGLRLGYAASTPEIAAALNKVREPFNINRFSQIAGVTALKNTKFLNKVLKFVNSEKKYLNKEMKKLGLDFVDSATNFIMVDFKKDTADLNRFLLKNGIIIRCLGGWGLPNAFRVTVGLRKENKKFIECLGKYLV
jgi:histidinol-phosphate aminotransferase